MWAKSPLSADARDTSFSLTLGPTWEVRPLVSLPSNSGNVHLNARFGVVIQNGSRFCQLMWSRPPLHAHNSHHHVPIPCRDICQQRKRTHDRWEIIHRCPECPVPVNCGSPFLLEFSSRTVSQRASCRRSFLKT